MTNHHDLPHQMERGDDRRPVWQVLVVLVLTLLIIVVMLTLATTGETPRDVSGDGAGRPTAIDAPALDS